jgi:hypothetical protein
LPAKVDRIFLIRSNIRVENGSRGAPSGLRLLYLGALTREKMAMRMTAVMTEAMTFTELKSERNAMMSEKR